LRELAAALRESSADRGGIITAGPAAPVSLSPALPCRNEGPDPWGLSPWGFSFWGPRLDLAVPAVIPGAIRRFPVPVLCAALIRSGTGVAGTEAAGMDAAAEGLLPFSFRAAAAANMSFTALESGEPGYSFIWKTGEPRWLPRPGRRTPLKETPG
jgi:hypothetical protein